MVARRLMTQIRNEDSISINLHFIVQNNSQVALSILNKPKFTVVQKNQVQDFVQSLVLGFDPNIVVNQVSIKEDAEEKLKRAIHQKVYKSQIAKLRSH